MSDIDYVARATSISKAGSTFTAMADDETEGNPLADAEMSLSIGKSKRAFAIYRILSAERNCSAATLERIVDSLMERSYFRSCCSLIERWMRAHGESAGLTVRMASALSEGGHLDRATSLLRDRHERQAPDVSTMRALAHLELRSGDDVAASRLYDEILKTDATDAASLAFQTAVLSSQGCAAAAAQVWSW